MQWAPVAILALVPLAVVVTLLVATEGPLAVYGAVLSAAALSVPAFGALVLRSQRDA